jgi:L-2-hydroxyglutarate oxidase LhgO
MRLPAEHVDYLVVGAGIIGLAMARNLKLRFPTARILVIDKESDVGSHASGRNSGVLHAGFYYSSDSLKARLCVKGNEELRSYCKQKGIPLNECGKLVVATSEEEVPRLQELVRRGVTNGSGTSLISAAEAKKLQPDVTVVGDALYSPRTAASDPKAVAQALRQDLLDAGVIVRTNCAFLEREGEGVFRTSQGSVKAEVLVNCAGLYADKIAQQFGFGSRYTILPFKGLYLKYAKNKTDIRMHIYPVPDPAYPFLGVHFTKTVDGSIKIGPTAIPALWRENYSGFKNFKLGELVDIGMREASLFLTNSFNFRKLAIIEMQKYARNHFISLAQRLVPSIDPNGFGDFAPPGIRAQLMNKETKELVQDFIVEGDKRSVHILNAVSPGWTCSFPFAEYVVENYLS